MKKNQNRADWSLWAYMADAELWQVVALSLDIEPKHLSGYEPRPIVGGPFDDCQEDFKRRLAIAINNIGQLEITAIANGGGVRTRVTLVSLRAWGERLLPPWDFPDKYPASSLQGPTAKAVSGEAMPRADSHSVAWKDMARDLARQIIARDRARDLYPSQENIADEIAKVFRKDGTIGPGGKPLTGAYIKRHALKGISSEQGKRLSTTTGQSK